MLTIQHELPDWAVSELSELKLLAVARANRKQLGPTFDFVREMGSSNDGRIRLAFHLTGANRHGAEKDVAAFMRDLTAEVAKRLHIW